MTRAAIKHAEDRLREAVLLGSKNDTSALEGMFHERLLCTLPDGRILRADDVLDEYRTGRHRVTHCEPRELVIELHEHTAIANVRVNLRGESGGQPFSGTYRHTRTYVREGGEWLIAADHATELRD
ncbi:nuclear transport factor 2 family protein [Labilithrix luteola]|nr:nuclear transport factor 2 family protein [Labilithrix luteola]